VRLPKARYWPCTSHWTNEQSKCSTVYHQKCGEKIIRLRKTKLLSDALLDENHISPEIEENLDFILAKNATSMK
jgi:hypothetical protein